MALPQHKTCLSILRSILGPGAGGEARFAKKIGRSTSWLKKASCGQIALTRDAALAIAYETGASVKWLLDADTTKPLLDSEGKPYTLETYANYRSQDRAKVNEEDKQNSSEVMVGVAVQMLTIYLSALEKNRGGFFTFRIQETLDDLGEFFGYADADIFQNQIASKILEEARERIMEHLPPSPQRMAEIRNQWKQLKGANSEAQERLVKEWQSKAPKNIRIKNCGKFWEIDSANEGVEKLAPAPPPKPTRQKQQPSRKSKRPGGH